MNGLKLFLCVHCRVGTIQAWRLRGSAFEQAILLDSEGVAAATGHGLTGGGREQLSNKIAGCTGACMQRAALQEPPFRFRSEHPLPSGPNRMWIAPSLPNPSAHSTKPSGAALCFVHYIKYLHVRHEDCVKLLEVSRDGSNLSRTAILLLLLI